MCLRLLRRAILILLLSSAAIPARAFDGPELYTGEKALSEAARQEGLLIAGNIIPSLNKWDGVIDAFNRRYPGITVVYNDIGSSAVGGTPDAKPDRPHPQNPSFFSPSAGGP